MRRLLMALALLPAPPGGPAVHESAHYRLEVAGDIGDPADYLRLAEALYAQLAAYHGATPSPRRRLEIRFWDTREAYLAGGQADGLTREELDAGGYYATKTQRAYFWKQPSAYATRHLFLHELTHQFQYLAVLGGSQRPGQSWYLEGVAEEFGYHRWDGTTLQTGLSDVVCLERRVVDVKARAAAGTFDLVAIIEGRSAFDRADFWGVVHFLRHGADPATQRLWRTLERKLWKGAGNAVVARELLAGGRGPALAAAARTFVAAVPHTWAIEWIEWDMRGDALRGWSATQALLRTHAGYAGATWIEATVEPGTGRAAIGVGQTKGPDLTGLALEADGTVHWVGRASGGERRVDPARPVRLRVEALADGTLRGTVDGTPVADARVAGGLTGHCALLVGGGERCFRAWAVAPPP
jgi:hypothetical protein